MKKAWLILLPLGAFALWRWTTPASPSTTTPVAEKVTATQVRNPDASIPATMTGSQALLSEKEFVPLLEKNRRDADEAMLRGNLAEAHQMIDAAIASAPLAPHQQQRLKTIQLAPLGMLGQQDKMIALTQQIIDLDPHTELAQQLRQNLTRLQDIQQQGPQRKNYCETCHSFHNSEQPHQEPSTKR